MKRIYKLTKAQQDRMAEFRDKWIEIGLDTRPADRPRAEKAIIEMYRVAKLPAPRIVWCGSPLGNALTRAIVKQSPAKIGASVRDSVRDSVWDSVWASVWASVRDSVRASVGDSVWDSVWGQHDANWLAFYEYFNQVCDLKTETIKLSGLWELAQSAGWAIPHEKICWVSERHNKVIKDAPGRLHCENGPAVKYPDGWGIYRWHGVAVSANIVERPDTITIADIDAEVNTEVRRVMVEQYDNIREPGAFIVDSGATEIARDHVGVLYSRPMANDEPFIMLRVLNKTSEPDGSFKPYFLRPDPRRYNGDAGRIPQAAAASMWCYRNARGDIVRDANGNPRWIFDDWRDYTPEFES